MNCTRHCESVNNSRDRYGFVQYVYSGEVLVLEYLLHVSPRVSV